MAAVLYVVPDAHHDAPQLKGDVLRVGDGVAQPAVFEPPAVAAALGLGHDAPAPAQRGLHIFQAVCVGGRHKGHRVVLLFYIIEDGTAQQCGGLGSSVLAEQMLADPVGHARPRPHRPVAGGVDEHFGVHPPGALAGLLAALHPEQSAVPNIHFGDVGVQKKGQARLAGHRVQKHVVPEQGVAVGIGVEVAHLQRAQHAHLLAEQVARAHSAPCPHPDLAAGIAAQHRAVLDEHDLKAKARGLQRRADAGGAAAHHGQIGV